MATANYAERAQLDAAQMALKILANSTSYGIFFELNVEDLTKLEMALCFSRYEAGFEVKIDQSETPGQYFHPLLATLITGAVRLMLACAERLALDAGLDWVFCDTDSIPIAKSKNMAEPTFWQAVNIVRDWFTRLNPYAKPGSILKLEDVNYGLLNSHSGNVTEPLYCLAISAKRYALFNLDDHGMPILRKASGHGLGHLIAPYGDADAPSALPPPMTDVNDIGVERWQHDVWHRIVTATLEGHPEQVRFAGLPRFNRPSVSQYGATTPKLLRWFNVYNCGKPYREQVRPFGFMLAFQAARALEMTADMPDTTIQTRKSGKQLPLRSKAMKRENLPRAVAPVDRDHARAATQCFDRDSGKAVPAKYLKTYTQALVRYHLHPEAKFLGGDFVDRGVTRRRHIQATEIQRIGKGANRWEEQFHLGADLAAQAAYGMSPEEQEHLNIMTREAIGRFGQRRLAKASDISRNTLATVVMQRVCFTSNIAERLRFAIRKLNNLSF